MSNREDQVKPYKPEDPVDAATRQKEQEEIRGAAKHAAQEMAAEDLGKDDKPISHEQAEKELHDAVHRVQQENSGK